MQQKIQIKIQKKMEDDLNSYFEVIEDLMIKTLFQRIKYLINYK